MQRVTDGLLVPIGRPKKIISKVELKLSALELPPLDAGHPPKQSKAGAVKGAPEVPAGATPSVGSVAEKLAQFLANLYHLVRGCSCVVCSVGVTNIP